MDAVKRIGLDKMKFSNLRVKNLDVGRLEPMKQAELTYSATGRCIWYMPGTNAGIRKIVIKDNDVFSDLTIGCTTNSYGALIEYTYLTVTVANAKGCNLENMTYAEYSLYLENILSYLETEYGIILDAGQMKVDYIEINANIFLQDSFSEYNRTLRLFTWMFKNLGKLSSYAVKKDDSAVQETHRRGNQSREIVFYNKTAELKTEGIYVDEDILRVEIRLKTARVIKDAFGSRYWKDLDDLKFTKYFYKHIYTELSDGLERWQGKRQKDLKKLIKMCRTDSKRNWHHLLMEAVRNKSERNTVPYILDIEQVYDAFRQLPDPNRNMSRALKPFGNIKITDDVYRKHGIRKAHEILDAVRGYAEEIWQCFQT